MLPDQWIATAFVQGGGAVTAAGNLIPDILPVGPNPQATPVPNDEALAIDDGMKWMVDFGEAERLGMALRLTLPPTAGPPRITLLLVFGVKRSLDSAASATRLKELIEAHKYTDGLSLVTQGTPTNNTEDAASGFTTDDPGHERSFRLILGEPQFQTGDGSNGDELSKALGLPPELLARTGNADAREQREARDMNRALWPSTWGYYLEQMMGLGDVNGSQPARSRRRRLTPPWNMPGSTSWIMCVPAGRSPRCAPASSLMAFCPSRPSIRGARCRKTETGLAR